MIVKFKIKLDSFDDVRHLIDRIGTNSESIINDIVNNFLVCYEVTLDKVRVGIILTRISLTYGGEHELVISHAVADDVKTIPVNFYDVLGKALPELARKLKCDSIRHHADRAGMVKMLQKYSYYVSEIVYKKDVKNCQIQGQIPVRKTERKLLMRTTA